MCLCCYLLILFLWFVLVLLGCWVVGLVDLVDWLLVVLGIVVLVVVARLGVSILIFFIMRCWLFVWRVRLLVCLLVCLSV